MKKLVPLFLSSLSFGSFCLAQSDIILKKPQKVPVNITSYTKKLNNGETRTLFNRERFVAIDYDQDGLQDLISGTFAGNVWFRKNIGSKEKPVFAKRQALVYRDGDALKSIKIPHC